MLDDHSFLRWMANGICYFVCTQSRCDDKFNRMSSFWIVFRPSQLSLPHPLLSQIILNLSIKMDFLLRHSKCNIIHTSRERERKFCMLLAFSLSALSVLGELNFQKENFILFFFFAFNTFASHSQSIFTFFLLSFFLIFSFTSIADFR